MANVLAPERLDKRSRAHTGGAPAYFGCGQKDKGRRAHTGGAPAYFGCGQKKGHHGNPAAPGSGMKKRAEVKTRQSSLPYAPEASASTTTFPGGLPVEGYELVSDADAIGSAGPGN